RVVLQEGDTVTFGHPDWKTVAPGAWARQPNSPFYFLFEHCHCSLDQMRCLHGEFPEPVAAGASPEASCRMGLALEAPLPQGASATQGALPPCSAPSEVNGPLGCRHPASSFSSRALPRPSAASTRPPLALPPFTGSLNFSSHLPETSDGPPLGASPDSSLEGSIRSPSCVLRSASPEYMVLGEEIPGPAEPSPQGDLQTENGGSLIPESPKSNCPDPRGESEEECPVGCRPGSPGGFPHENDSSEARTRPLPAACLGHAHSLLPSPACLQDSVAAGLGHTQRGARIGTAELPKDVQPLACSFQTVVGGSPESGLSPPSTKDLVSGSPDHSQEIIKREIDEGPEEMSELETSCFSEPGAEERITEPMEEEVQITKRMEQEERITEPMKEKEQITEPMEQEERITKQMQQEERITEPMKEEERIAEPMEQEERITKRMQQEERITEPMKEKERITKPMEQEERITKQMQQEERITEPMEEKEQITKPMEQEERITKRMQQEEQITEPMKEEEQITEPMQQEEQITKQLQQEERITEPMKEKEQIAEPMEEAVTGSQGMSADHAKDGGLGTEGTVGGHSKIFMEKPLQESCPQETELAADGGATDSSLADKVGSRAPDSLDLISGSSGGRTPGDPLCGLDPGRVSSARLGAAQENGPDGPSTAVPLEIQSGRGAREAESQGGASEGDGDVKASSQGDTRLSAVDRHLGPRGRGSADLEAERGLTGHASLGEQPLADAEAQAGGAGEEEKGPAVAEAGEEGGASGAWGDLQHSGSRSDAHVAGEAPLQPSSGASAAGLLVHEVSPKGQFSREGTFTAATVSGAAQESLSSEVSLETSKEDPTLATAAPPAGLVCGERGVLEVPLDADLLGPPGDLDGNRLEERSSQRSEASPRGGQEGLAAEKEAGYGSSGRTEADPVAELQLPVCELGHEEEEEEEEEEERAGSISTCASLAVPPGGREPDCESGSQEEVDQDGASGGGGGRGEEELEAQGGRSVAAAFTAGAAAGEGDLENQPQGLLGQPPAFLPVPRGNPCSPLGRRLEGGGACSSSASAGKWARLLPFWVPGDSREGEEVPCSDDFCADALLLLQWSEKDAEGRLGSENSPLLPERGGSEEEHSAELNNEVQATTRSCSVGTKPSEDAQQHHEVAETEETEDHSVERQTSCHESSGTSPDQSTQDGCQEGNALLPELHAGELKGLENSSGLEPQGGNVGEGLLSLDDFPTDGGAGEDVRGPGVAVECLTPPGPEGCSGGAVVGTELEQSPEGSPSGEGGGDIVSLGLWAVGSGKCSQTPHGSAARHLGRQSRPALAVGLESSSCDELDLRISNSEAEREGRGSPRAPGTSGREAAVPKGRDALSSEPVGRLDGVTETSGAHGRLAVQGQREDTSQETGGVPPEAFNTLAQQNSPCDGLGWDPPSATFSVPQTSIANVAVGVKSPPLMKAAASGEELEDGAAEEVERGPSDPSCVSGEVSHLLERDARLGRVGPDPSVAPGVAEEAGSGPPEDCAQAGCRFAGQPGMEALEVGETPAEHLQNATPARSSVGEAEGAQKVKGEALLHLQPGVDTQQSQETVSQGCSKSSERCKSPFPEKAEPEGCSSRKKRLLDEDQASGSLDSDHGSSGQKRLRWLDSGSGLPFSPGTPSPPSGLQRHQDGFGSAVGTLFQPRGSRHSEKMDAKKRDRIAQIVRMYFDSTRDLEENLEAEMSLLPFEAGTSEESDCNSAAKPEAQRSPGAEEGESSPAPQAELHTNRVQCPDPSLDDHGTPASAPSRSLGSHAEEPGPELAPHVPGSAGKASFSEDEEEEFQSRISSVLEHSLLTSPEASPKAQHGQEPWGKDVDLVFSDISNGSMESSPEPEHRNSTGTGGKPVPEMLCEAVAIDLSLEGAFRVPEATDVGWCEETTSAVSGMRVSSCENIQSPEGDSTGEPEDHLGAAGENMETPVLRQAGDGEDGRETATTEASEGVTSCVSSPGAETREELDGRTDEMQIGGGAFLQRSNEDSPPTGKLGEGGERVAEHGGQAGSSP
ncbi:uncharacterized protein LOC125424901, partial [Sphaerodactylus townsendi]|uniref:uncharacterized protein LOC125424901 n=1 Tax=Sphaerodactylus townsendi TaxID=933632 RepID=UPI002026BF79